MGTNLVNLQERQITKQYEEFYSEVQVQKCANFNGSLDVVARPAKKEPVTKESYTKDYIKLLTNFNSKEVNN